jgi:PAS domain S-box-containing protein
LFAAGPAPVLAGRHFQFIKIQPIPHLGCFLAWIPGVLDIEIFSSQPHTPMLKIDAYDLAAYVKSHRSGPLLSIMDEVRDFVFIKDLEGRFLFSNRAHLAHLGRPESQVLGKNDFDLFPHRLAESFYAAETHLFETRIPVVRLQESMDSHGTKFYSTAIKMLVCDKHENALGLVGTVHRIAMDNSLDVEQSKSHVLAVLRAQPGITPSQLKAFEATLPSVIVKK